jgi:hypothetical protein
VRSLGAGCALTPSLLSSTILRGVRSIGRKGFDEGALSQEARFVLFGFLSLLRLSKLDFDCSALFHELATAAKDPRLQGSMNMWHLSNLVWSCAIVQHFDEALFAQAFAAVSASSVSSSASITGSSRSPPSPPASEQAFQGDGNGGADTRAQPAFQGAMQLFQVRWWYLDVSMASVTSLSCCFHTVSARFLGIRYWL